MMVVRPFCILSMAACTSFSVAESSAEVASSKIRIGLSFAMARAMARR